MARQRGSILVLSNRLPITVRRGRRGLELQRSTGGLVAALEPALERLGGTWLGWPGIQLRSGQRLPKAPGRFAIAPVALTRTEVTRYYHGFSNRTIWPLFHSLTGRSSMRPREWESYEKVNERFAERACELAGPNDLIWIHDYHLMRVAPHIRRLRPEAQLAFFLHIPFPPYDVYRILPWYREILRGLLACDLVGFHCPGYVANFLDCVERLVGARVDAESGLVEQGERSLRVGAFPLGIDFDGYEQRARDAPSAQQRRGSEQRQIVLGVDRLDYTKGIPERIRSFERLLERHREYRERVVMIQIAVPSRDQVDEYQALKRELDELVGRVNGRFGTQTWTPIQYLYRSVSQERLAALYRDADVGLVTPLRDGMNLVAKEFVASQVEDPGVLVLSRLAGAAETMHEALQVNPYNIESVADALHRALSMDAPERADRMLALRRRERRNDVHAWLDRILKEALAPSAGMRPTTDEELEAWLGDYLRGRSLALFLDYDGTLSPIAEHPDEAGLSPSMVAALADCAGRPDTDLTIVSGRAVLDVQKQVNLRDVTYAGNHGLEIRGPGLRNFDHEDAAHFAERARELARALGRIRTPGVWVEEKGPSLTLHYRQADPAQHTRVREIAHDRIGVAGFQARNALCAVEARPPIGWDKGHAVLHVLRSRYGRAWSERIRVLYAGDDETDEDAFAALAGLGITIRVGSGPEWPTRAVRHLPNTAAVERLLLWLAARPA